MLGDRDDAIPCLATVMMLYHAWRPYDAMPMLGDADAAMPMLGDTDVCYTMLGDADVCHTMLGDADDAMLILCSLAGGDFNRWHTRRYAGAIRTRRL